MSRNDWHGLWDPSPAAGWLLRTLVRQMGRFSFVSWPCSAPWGLRCFSRLQSPSPTGECRLAGCNRIWVSPFPGSLGVEGAGRKARRTSPTPLSGICWQVQGWGGRGHRTQSPAWWGWWDLVTFHQEAASRHPSGQHREPPVLSNGLSLASVFKPLNQSVEKEGPPVQDVDSLSKFRVAMGCDTFAYVLFLMPVECRAQHKPRAFPCCSSRHTHPCRSRWVLQAGDQAERAKALSRLLWNGLSNCR